MEKPTKIGKFEAAERQLCLAVRLFFDREDLVGVHTLTGAASQVLRDLARQQGFLSPIRENEMIRPDKKKEWMRILDHARNFFKHADRDASANLHFYPKTTPWLMFEAALVHNYLTKGFVPETLVLISWMNLKYPDILLDGPLKKVAQDALATGVNPEDFEVLRIALAKVKAEYTSGSWPPKG